jgi:hypothetical protein
MGKKLSAISWEEIQRYFHFYTEISNLGDGKMVGSETHPT